MFKSELMLENLVDKRGFFQNIAQKKELKGDIQNIFEEESAEEIFSRSKC